MDPRLPPQTKIAQTMEAQIKNHVIPSLKKFISIPNLSRSFDPAWDSNGLMEQAADLCITYATSLAIEGLSIEKSKDEGKTLFLFGDVKPTKPENEAKTIVFYGHLDKQPHTAEKWREGLHPTKPVVEGDLLYGRGSHDDGYAFFLAASLVKSLQK